MEEGFEEARWPVDVEFEFGHGAAFDADLEGTLVVDPRERGDLEAGIAVRQDAPPFSDCRCAGRAPAFRSGSYRDP